MRGETLRLDERLRPFSSAESSQRAPLRSLCGRCFKRADSRGTWELSLLLDTFAETSITVDSNYKCWDYVHLNDHFLIGAFKPCCSTYNQMKFSLDSPDLKGNFGQTQSDHEVGYYTPLLCFREKYRMHPLNEGIFRWINKGQYFWYLLFVQKHWLITVLGKQRCSCEVTGETSCHSFSLVPQLQNAVVLMRLFLDNSFFNNPEWQTNSSPLKRW